MSKYTALPSGFYLPGAVTAARNLLGCLLVHDAPEGLTAGAIVETEAYAGREDAASHSYRRAAPVGGHRTNVMFAEGGHVYVYLIYGMYNCFNVVTAPEGEPQAVLVRALEPVEGVGLMERRRGTKDAKKLCSGPGKLCIAMGITREHYGIDLRTDRHLFIAEGRRPGDGEILATPRVNVDYAGEASKALYRFLIGESKFLSTGRYVRR